MCLLAWEFLSIKSVLHFAFLHLLSGYYYYDYLVIGVLRPFWFTEILWIGLLLSKDVKQLKIIIIISLWRRVDDFSFSIVFLIILMKYHIMFIIFVFRLGSRTLFCFFAEFLLPYQGISHWMRLFVWGGWMIFHFSIV